MSYKKRLRKIVLFAKIKIMEDKEIQKSLHHIHDSAIPLAGRIFFIILVLEIVYGAFIYFFFFTEIGRTIQYQRNYIIIFSYPFKFILQAYSVIYVLLFWATNNYYITENKIVHCKGILNIDEEIYDISSIRSVKSYQNIIGRIFNYGNVIVEVSASGGYHKNILLIGIASPKKYERILNEFLEKNKKSSLPKP